MTPSSTALIYDSQGCEKIADGRWKMWQCLSARCWFALVVYLTGGLLVYAPALGGGLIWDDTYLVGENPFFRSPIFSGEVFRHYLFFNSFSTYYRPVQNWSYMLDYWLWRGDPMGYHCTNVILHSLSAFLLWLFLRSLLPGLVKSVKGQVINVLAISISIVWLVHPIHNAAVAYISGRADSLASLFALSAWVAIRQHFSANRLWKKTAFALISVLAALLALCSKEIALGWIALFVTHLLFFEKAQTRLQKIAAVAGVCLIIIVYGLLHSLPAHRAAMAGASTSLDARLLLMLRALGDYTRLLLWPDQLYMERSISSAAMYRNVGSWRANAGREYLSLIGLAVLILVPWSCLKKWQGRELRVFGALWFALGFLPISNLFPLNAEVAEHSIYLASIGALIFGAGLVMALPRRWHALTLVFGCAAVAAFGVRTAVRSADWIDAETFCVRTIASGGGTPRIFSALAAVYGQRGDMAKQERVLRKMVAEFPDFAPARMNLGICLAKQGRAADAEVLLKAETADAAKNSALFPRTWSAALNLAHLRRDAHDFDSALAILRDARARFPETWPLVKCEAEITRETRGVAVALPLVESFAADHWWHSDAWLTLGAWQFENGDAPAAIGTLRQASRLDIYDARSLAGIAQIELESGRAVAALDAQLAAMSRAPNQPAQYLALGMILEKLGRKNEANAAVQKAQLLVAQARGEARL